MSTHLAPVGDADQTAYWNGPGGRRWTERSDAPEAIFAPIAELLYARARLAPGERVIDVGCGGGATTLAIAAQVGAAGGVIGVDVSALMIARALERAGATSAAKFVLADAGSHDFSPGWANMLFSRFGVMFFADPVASFANLRKGLARGGRVVFACWREARRNPWQTIALKAACKHVPRLPDVGPEDPGPFSFADEARVRRILSEAGFETIALTPVDLELDVAAGQGLEAALATLQQIGAASRALEGQPEALRAAAVAEIRAALAPHRRGLSVPLGAAIWIVEAINP
jgi:ubiquinone/menaquinone biosynthesis C-methylase UbiE